jgi:hypothetical protein
VTLKFIGIIEADPFTVLCTQVFTIPDKRNSFFFAVFNLPVGNKTAHDTAFNPPDQIRILCHWAYFNEIDRQTY